MELLQIKRISFYIEFTIGGVFILRWMMLGSMKFSVYVCLYVLIEVFMANINVIS